MWPVSYIQMPATKKQKIDHAIPGFEDRDREIAECEINGDPNNGGRAKSSDQCSSKLLYTHLVKFGCAQSTENHHCSPKLLSKVRSSAACQYIAATSPRL